MVASGGGDGGFGGGGAIWAIVLIALLGFNRNGNCGDGGCGREAIDNAELNARFNSLEGQIQNVNDLAAVRETYKEACETNMNVTQQGSNVLAAVAEAKFDNAIIAKDAQLSAQACCCETNRNVDSVKWEIERGNCGIMGAIHAEGEATRALLTADKIESLRDKLQEYQLRESQCAQNATLINALRPYPQPTYITCNPQTVAYPTQLGGFSGCGCSGF